MPETRWWKQDKREELYDLQAEGWVVGKTRAALSAEGWVPADEMFFPAGAMILREHLSQMPVPDVDELVERVRLFAHRPRPTLPDPSSGFSLVLGAAARRAESEPLWVDPARVLPGRPGIDAFFRDQGDWTLDSSPAGTAQRQDPVLGLAEFAARIAAERGDTGGLTELFGPSYSTSAPMLSLHGWETPLGAVFRVDSNGNHRLTALAALNVPCVLAEVTWLHGPFDTSSGTNEREDEDRRTYRLLLHTLGIASYPDPSDFTRNDTGIITQWPVLIDTPSTATASLRALESLTGRQATNVGRLPRSAFDDPARLASLGAKAARTLDLLTEELENPSARRKWFQRSGKR